MWSLYQFLCQLQHVFLRPNWQNLLCTTTCHVIPLYNVVNLVHWIKCNLQYVGCTTTEFKVRFRNHKSSMKTKKKTCEVAIHLNKTPHTFSVFTFQCTDQIRTSSNHDTDTLLITKEAYWSGQLFSLAPFGLNKRQEFTQKIAFTIHNYTLYAAGTLRGPFQGSCYFCAGFATHRPFVGILLRPIQRLCFRIVF